MVISLQGGFIMDNKNNSQGTLWGLIVLILVCVAGYLYAQNLHLQKEVDHYKYYFDDDYSDTDDDILSQILKPFTHDSDSVSGSFTVDNPEDAKSEFYRN